MNPFTYFAQRGDISGIDAKNPSKRNNAAMAMQIGHQEEGQERHWSGWLHESVQNFIARQHAQLNFQHS